MTDTYPRLRPLDLGALRNLGLSAGLAAAAGEPPAWPSLIQALRADPSHRLELLRALAWGMDDLDRLWWTCIAARLEEIASGRGERSQALVLSERWLREKDDSVRYEAFRRSREEGSRGPASMVGMAAFVAGPSLAPPDKPVEAPPPSLPFEAALGVLVATAAAPAMGEDGFTHVNAIGLDVASGADGREPARNALAALQTPAAPASPASDPGPPTDQRAPV